MNVATAFIYGAVFAALVANVVLCLMNLKQARKEAEQLEKMGNDILEDIEVGKHYIDVANDLAKRIHEIEEKVNAKEAKATANEEKTETAVKTKKVRKTKEA